MDNEITVQEELESTAAEIPADAVEESETEAAPGEGSQAEELQQLRAEIMELRLKLALLTGGAAPERLCEGVKLAAGIMSADGTEPDDAAAEVLARVSAPQACKAQRSSVLGGEQGNQ